MRVDFNVQIDHVAQPGNGFISGERVQHAQRVGKTDAAGAAVFGAPGHFGQKSAVGAGRVFGTERNFAPAGYGLVNHPRDLRQHPFAALAQLVAQVNVGHGNG